MSEDVQASIDRTVKEHPVVLYMKGKRAFPKCGFSAAVVNMLDELLDDYVTVDVLEDPAVRQGIKDYTNWPTIPQLYVNGEFVGGSDIVRSMYSTGELHGLMGVEFVPAEPPDVTVTDAAVEALRQALMGAPHDAVRVEISRDFRYGMNPSPVQEGDLVVEEKGFTFLFDHGSARRADGMTLDYRESFQGGGFAVDNPNEPRVEDISVQQLKEWMDQGEDVELLDVRTAMEWDTAHVEGFRLFDQEEEERVTSLDRDRPLVFFCHTGRRSRDAAEYFARQGFRRCYNVAGGIEAWSVEIDPSVPRY
ncbi:MAG: Grx4 family monothiol glutaredoxin [Myxococcota bacterium]